jgi:hypothetical protein
MGIVTSIRSWLARQIAPQSAASAHGQSSAGYVAHKGYALPRVPAPQDRVAVEAQERLRLQLQGEGSSGWWSDHYEESLSYNSWSYIAISALMRSASSAKFAVNNLIPPNQADADNLNQGGDADRKPVRWDHPLCALLRKPNPSYGLSGLIARAVMQRRLTGTAMIWVRPNALGLPGELYVIPTALARPLAPTPDMPMGGWSVSASSLLGFQFLSQIGFSGSTVANIDARDIIRVKYPHPLTEADGQSPQNGNARHIDVSNETEETLWSVYQQGVMPGYIAAVDPNIVLKDGDADAMQAEIDDRYAGSQNAGKVMVTSSLTLQKLTLSPTEVIPEGLRNQNRDNVLAAHGVPPIGAGVTEAGSFSSLYAARQQMTDGAVQPELDDIASSLTVGLCRRYPGGDALEITLKAKPVNDHEFELKKAYSKMASACYTVDEIRQSFGDGPHPDPEQGKKTAGAVPTAGSSEEGSAGTATGGTGASGTVSGTTQFDTGIHNPTQAAEPDMDPLAKLFARGKSLPRGLWNGHFVHPQSTGE